MRRREPSPTASWQGSDLWATGLRFQVGRWHGLECGKSAGQEGRLIAALPWRDVWLSQDSWVVKGERKLICV